MDDVRREAAHDVWDIQRASGHNATPSLKTALGELTIVLKEIALPELPAHTHARILVFVLAIFSALLCATGGSAWAQQVDETSLPLEGRLDPAGGVVTLSWPLAKRQIVGSVTVSRRRLGREGPTSWEPLGPPKATAVWRDAEIEPGDAFEYQVVRRQREIVDAGYWVAGWEVPARAESGTALLLVDEEVAEGISLHLERFRRDLVGAGWRVVAHEVPRHRDLEASDLAAALEIRDWISDRVAEDPEAEHAVVLVGHVPILRSGRSAPDGHDPRPHPTDAFYADIDGEWDISFAGQLLNDVVPGNGIELQIGRIDFAPISGRDRDMEVRLLQQYFDKNHHWRHGLLGDLRDGYAGESRLKVEEHGLLNLLGADRVVQGGHNEMDADARDGWLWGVDFGSWKFDDYFEETGVGTRQPIFAINFGSHKQMFDRGGNAMVALLAQPWNTIAVGWGGRPSWRLHLMALGGTIGEVHRRTLNNGSPSSSYPLGFEYFPTGQYVFRQPVWVNLLGDPTLRAYPLAPPVEPVLRGLGSSGLLSWEPSPDGDTLGYRVWRLDADGTQGEPIGGDAVLSGTETVLDDAAEASRHLIRAYGMKQTPAGSFYTYSQGSYAVPAGQTFPEVVTIEVRPDGSDMFIPFEHVIDGSRYLVSIVHPPETGRISAVSGGWSYTPEAPDPGTEMAVTIFDGQASRPGRLEVMAD